MTKIITTVGTSLFSNFQRDEVKDRYGRDYASISINVPLRNIENDNPTAVGIYDDKYKHYIKSITENIEDYWLNDKYKENEQASAEIASILKIVREDPKVEFEVHLLATDTLLSVLAGEMIAAWFARHPQLARNIRQVLFQRTPAIDFKAQKESDYVVKDLRIEASSRYESGFMHLIEVLDKLYDQSKQAGQHIIFNVTGGYKAIIPIFTIYGQLRGIPLNYIYDDSNLQDPGLISIENLPFNFDWCVAELFADFITDQEI